MIRVITIDNKTMEFTFLDCFTGDDLNLSRPSHTIEHRNAFYAWAELPSTAHLVQPGNLADPAAQSCGLLFISDLYMKGSKKEQSHVVEADYQAITAIGGGGEGKWPISAGAIAEVIRRLNTYAERLPDELRVELESTLKHLDSMNSAVAI